MTNNQIAYQNFLENARHNMTGEKENQRHNTVSEAETGRSNLAREFETNRNNVANLFENSRANKANEALRKFSNYEDKRSHIAREKIDSKRNAEIARSNRANEYLGSQNIGLGYANISQRDRALAEQSRSNKEYENVARNKNIIDERNVQYQHSDRARSNDISANHFFESQRHNKAAEKEQHRSNTINLVMGREGIVPFVGKTLQNRKSKVSKDGDWKSFSRALKKGVLEYGN